MSNTPEGTYPKHFEDIQFASEANVFNAHGTGDGSDHANVATNTTHRTSSGTDHSLIASKTSYWSAPGESWQTKNPDTDQVQRTSNRTFIQANTIICVMPVHLPHGAVVTSVRVEGTAAGEVWVLNRNQDDGINTQMAAALIGSTDSSISAATIDNQNYQYVLVTTTLDTGDEIWGVFITYTTNYT